MVVSERLTERSTLVRWGGMLLLAMLFYLYAQLRNQGMLPGDGLTVAGFLIAGWALWRMPARSPSIRLLPFVIVFGVASFLLKGITMRYFLLAFTAALIVEIVLGKSGGLLLTLLFIVSPVFGYLSEVFTFPIRLFLSNAAGKCLQWAGMPVEVAGNTIFLEEVPFHVDPACMGLQMLALSLLSGVFVLAHFQFLSRKYVGFFWSSLFLLGVLALNLICNFLRIMVLVQFRIMPESAVHDLVGVLCLVFYVLLPSYFAAKLFVEKVGKPVRGMERAHQSYAVERFWVGVLSVAICVQVTMMPRPVSLGVMVPVEKVGYDRGEVSPGIYRYKSTEALIYVKQIPSFYSVEHSPQVCWKGSGLTLRNVTPAVIAGNRVYAGTLNKKDEELFTAWWFSNGREITVNPVAWRWRMFRGEPPFVLVNVTSESREAMINAAGEWLAGEGITASAE